MAMRRPFQSFELTISTHFQMSKLWPFDHVSRWKSCKSHTQILKLFQISIPNVNTFQFSTILGRRLPVVCTSISLSVSRSVDHVKVKYSSQTLSSFQQSNDVEDALLLYTAGFASRRFAVHVCALCVHHNCWMLQRTPLQRIPRLRWYLYSPKPKPTLQTHKPTKHTTLLLVTAISPPCVPKNRWLIDSDL